MLGTLESTAFEAWCACVCTRSMRETEPLFNTNFQPITKELDTLVANQNSPQVCRSAWLVYAWSSLPGTQKISDQAQLICVTNCQRLRKESRFHHHQNFWPLFKAIQDLDPLWITNISLAVTVSKSQVAFHWDFFTEKNLTHTHIHDNATKTPFNWFAQ